MAFTIKHPTSDLFWSSGLFGRIQLGNIPNIYTFDGSFIKNTKTNNYVNHRFNILHEDGIQQEFSMNDDGSIGFEDQFVGDGQFLSISSQPFYWVKTPITRGSALLEQSQEPEDEPQDDLA